MAKSLKANATHPIESVFFFKKKDLTVSQCIKKKKIGQLIGPFQCELCESFGFY